MTSPFGGSSEVLVLLFTFSSQNNGAEVRSGGSEGFWELDLLVNSITVGKRARYRSQSALSGHGQKAYTQLQRQAQYQRYCLMLHSKVHCQGGLLHPPGLPNI